MKALVARELSGPSGLDYTDVEDPADVVDQRSVVIDVGAAGVSFPDLLLLRGEYQLRLEPPFIPGMEVAGVVRSAPYESEFKPGQRVTALAMLGGWAEQVVVPPASIRHTPTTSTTPRPSRCLATTRRCISRWHAAVRFGTARRSWCSARPVASAPPPFRSQRHWVPR